MLRGIAAERRAPSPHNPVRRFADGASLACAAEHESGEQASTMECVVNRSRTALATVADSSNRATAGVTGQHGRFRISGAKGLTSLLASFCGWPSPNLHLHAYLQRQLHVPATRADTSSTERRRVVLVGDAEHGSALYWLPVVAFAWKNIAHYEPLVLLVRARSQGPPSASAEEGALHVVAQSLEALGIDFEVVDRASSCPLG
jgi:hypothetical protein